MKKKIILLILLYILVRDIFPCTIGVANPSITTSGRPILWKSRDINPNTVNTIRKVDDLTYDFIGVTSPGENRMWMGVNEEGFALANSLSNDLTVAEGNFNNGNLIFNALGNCSNLDDFENYLDYLTSSTLDLELRGNFVAFDGDGQTKLYEVNNSAYWIFPATTTTSPFQIRTNHSINGGGLEGFERFIRSQDIVASMVFNNELNVNNLLMHHIRDVSDSQSQAYQLPWTYGDPSPLLDTNFSINRRNTISAVVIEGAFSNQDTDLTTMWLIMGNPFTSYALPLVPKHQPNYSTYNNLSENSSELVNILWNSENNYLLDTSKFVNPNFSLMGEFQTLESQTYQTFEDLKEDYEDDEISESYLINYMNEKASQALAFSNQVLYNFTPNNDVEISQTSHLHLNPNPFTESLSISFTNEKKTPTSIKIYNLKGQLVKEYTSNEKTGKIKWNGDSIDKKKLPSGIYLVRYENSKEVITKKVLLMK